RQVFERIIEWDVVYATRGLDYNPGHRYGQFLITDAHTAWVKAPATVVACSRFDAAILFSGLLFNGSLQQRINHRLAYVQVVGNNGELYFQGLSYIPVHPLSVDCGTLNHKCCGFGLKKPNNVSPD